jgi:hypothetical protein
VKISRRTNAQQGKWQCAVDQQRCPPASKQSRARSQQHTNLLPNLVPHPLLPSSVPFFDPTCAVALGFLLSSTAVTYHSGSPGILPMRELQQHLKKGIITAHFVFKYLMFNFFYIILFKIFLKYKKLKNILIKYIM